MYSAEDYGLGEDSSEDCEHGDAAVIKKEGCSFCQIFQTNKVTPAAASWRVLQPVNGLDFHYKLFGRGSRSQSSRVPCEPLVECASDRASRRQTCLYFSFWTSSLRSPALPRHSVTATLREESESYGRKTSLTSNRKFPVSRGVAR